MWPDDSYKPPSSALFRYALISAIYVGAGVLQWLFNSFYYERVVDDALGMFTDLCSVGNVSVIILTQRLFGYYIHGRSAHGYADTSLRELIAQLRKEQLGLVGHRGLVPGSDQQVFTITLPVTLRKALDRAYSEVTLHSAGANVENGVDGTNALSELQTKTFETYHNLNDLFQRFINHVSAAILSQVCFYFQFLFYHSSQALSFMKQDV